MKHHETHARHWKPLVKYHKTFWNITKDKHFAFNATIFYARCRVSGDMHGVSVNIGDCGVGITPQDV